MFKRLDDPGPQLAEAAHDELCGLVPGAEGFRQRKRFGVVGAGGLDGRVLRCGRDPPRDGEPIDLPRQRGDGRGLVVGKPGRFVDLGEDSAALAVRPDALRHVHVGHRNTGVASPRGLRCRLLGLQVDLALGQADALGQPGDFVLVVAQHGLPVQVGQLGESGQQARLDAEPFGGGARRGLDLRVGDERLVRIGVALLLLGGLARGFGCGLVRALALLGGGLLRRESPLPGDECGLVLVFGLPQFQLCGGLQIQRLAFLLRDFGQPVIGGAGDEVAEGAPDALGELRFFGHERRALFGQGLKLLNLPGLLVGQRLQRGGVARQQVHLGRVER